VFEGKRCLTIFWRGASSGRLALVLVGVLILFSLAGATIPQEGLYAPGDIALWQKQHPTITALFKPVGFFRVFHSIPFLVTIFLLAVNTLTCTMVHFFKRGGISAFKGAEALKNSGFIILHLSLIALFIGGAWSSAVRMDGYIILTEGQSFKEEHRNYIRLVEGPLRQEKHKGFLLSLEKVHITYRQGKYPTEMTTGIKVGPAPKRMTAAEISVNHPLTYRGVDFTLDQVGFSPRLVIRDRKNGKILINSFVALKTFRNGPNREYRDFLPLPIFKNRVIVTLYPAYRTIEGKIEKTGEEPENPILLIEIEDHTGKTALSKYLPFKGKTGVGDHIFEFIGLRRSASFKVVEDPGYPLVLAAIWLGLIALILRYAPDLRGWFKDQTTDDR
jgi:cytochrome c biogenesis protein ResB